MPIAAPRSVFLRCAALMLALVPATLVVPRPAMAQQTGESRFEALLARFGGHDRYEGISSSNGRLEARSVDVATKYAGRLTEVRAAEGAVVEAGEVLAQLDDREVQAQLLAAGAAVQKARAARQMAEASVLQASSALDVARTTFTRIEKLHEDGHASQSGLDDARNARTAAEAALAMAQAQVAEAEAGIEAASADQERLRVALEDLTIRAPIRGRVLYRLREPGEVLAAGGAVMTLLDLGDVYMTVYLPAPVAGMLAINDEARIVLDPIPDYVIPANVTFISPEAQFTPKSVETEAERADLVFRVKLTIPRALLDRFEDHVKSGIRGLGFVRSDPGADWPADLAVKLPQDQ